MKRVLVAAVLCLLVFELWPGRNWAWPAAPATVLSFDELYGSIGVLGMEFSQKVRELEGKTVRMIGFMAPPLKADAVFFVLTRAPVALCPFCDSEADWPQDIMVVYLPRGGKFVQNNEPVAVTGVLEVGSATDPDSGFVSMLRLRNATMEKV